MSDPRGDPLVQEYERRAEEAEASPIPVFLKIARVIVWIVYAIVLATAILLTLNFLLRLFGANSDNAFVVWVYRSTDRAMQPFRGIFPTHQLDDSSAALDFSVLFAALVYFIIALLIDIGLRWLTNRLRRQQHQTVALRQQADAAAHDSDGPRAGRPARRPRGRGPRVRRPPGRRRPVRHRPRRGDRGRVAPGRPRPARAEHPTAARLQRSAPPAGLTKTARIPSPPSIGDDTVAAASS